MEPKSFKYFIVTENIFGIYRNFVIFSKPIKALVTIRILADLLLSSYFLIASGVIAKDVPLILANFHVIIALLVSLYHSKTYVEYASRLSSNHIACKTDYKYSTRINKFIKTGLIVCTAYFIFLSIILLIFLYYKVTFTTSYNSPSAFVTINKIYNHYRYHLEYAFMYFNLRTMSEQLMCVKRFPKEISIKNGLNGRCADSDVNQNYMEILDIVERWRIVFINISECSSLFNEVFGVQVPTYLLKELLIL